MARSRPPRAQRRARTREHEEAVRELERLSRLAPGGSADRPIAIASSAQVEPMAAAMRCPLCEAVLSLQSHEAHAHEGTLLRVARVRCPDCGVARDVYFRIAPALHS